MDLYKFGEYGWVITEGNKLNPTAKYVADKKYDNWTDCRIAFMRGASSNSRRERLAKLFYSEKPGHPDGPGIHYWI